VSEDQNVIPRLRKERDTARAELARLKYELDDLRNEVPQLKRAIIELSAELQEEKALRQRLLADNNG
jgi:predicted  nucleic acid-binding Zn-ribbon protein